MPYRTIIVILLLSGCVEPPPSFDELDPSDTAATDTGTTGPPDAGTDPTTDAAGTSDALTPIDDTGPGDTGSTDVGTPDFGPSGDDMGMDTGRDAGMDAGVDMAVDDAGPDMSPYVVTATFQDNGNDYGGTTDTELRLLQPDTNLGSLADREVKGTEGQVILIRWDLTAIPANAIVESATITLSSTANGSGSQNDVLAVNTPWREGEATWNQAFTGTAWEQSGCYGPNDRGPEVLGTIQSNAPNTVMVVGPNPALTARAQTWVATPDQNYGIVLQRETSGDGLHVWSREAADPSVRPKIEVTYRLP